MICGDDCGLFIAFLVMVFGGTRDHDTKNVLAQAFSNK